MVFYFLVIQHFFSMDIVYGTTLKGIQLDGMLGGAPISLPGMKGKALRFDGLNDYLDLAGPNDSCIADIRLCTQGLTVSFWMMPLSNASSFGYSQYIIGTMSNGNTGLGFVIEYAYPALYPFVRIRTDTQFTGCGLGIAQEIGQWYQFAYVWDNTFCTLYYNGIRITQCGMVLDTPSEPLYGLTVGANPAIKELSSRLLNADLDELYMFEYALNDDQIYRLYRNSFL